MSAVLEPPMTADEFLVWTETRDDDTRFELFGRRAGRHGAGTGGPWRGKVPDRAATGGPDHRRREDGTIERRTLTHGTLTLDPPGLILQDVFPAD